MDLNFLLRRWRLGRWSVGRWIHHKSSGLMDFYALVVALFYCFVKGQHGVTFVITSFMISFKYYINGGGTLSTIL